MGCSSARKANSFQWHHVEERTSPPKRWHDCFEEISNVEFAYPATPLASLVYGTVQKITVSETEAALRKMMKMEFRQSHWSR
ncbi:unnamed protein product [Heligmosomoides polygyrus]|uniref:Uncharacterized protein n=1 Tax=Heligmosomoides polygyrus TaxID=6339 RepID=A0A183GVB2_HELPZ|nr:unnamed protein product [Heligmosomoides polygyrus]